MSQGQVITFYSFKGGVGRTMALANVAFLAAESGLRVLVMDWDLEAPGLYYYFRSLMRASEIKNLKEAKGLLDLFWEWHTQLRSGKTEIKNELEKILKQGTYFKNMCVPIREHQSAPTQNGESKISCLHYIGAGRKQIKTPEIVPYAEALAKFSWQTFFEKDSGGVLLNQFRLWAKSNYDLILLDSRTGMADVSGICTMQMPDTVALCFVLNHQNIDGVSSVAAAIRSRRNEEVKLRAVPMRVIKRGSRGGSSEESDAIFRAETELSRIGGFSKSSLQEDFRLLAVEHAEHVPFYESLAPFVASDASLDTLTLNFVSLAKNLLGHPIQIPALPQFFIDEVRSRLQPRSATVDYILGLRQADPNRAVSELKALVEGALQADLDGIPIEESYIETILEAGFFAIDFAQVEYDSVLELQSQILELARLGVRTSQRPKLMVLYASAIQKFLDSAYYLEGEDELSLLEELDMVFARQNTTSANIERIQARRRAVRICLAENLLDSAAANIGDLQKLRSDLLKGAEGLSREQLEQLSVAEIDSFLLSGDIHYQSKRFNDARNNYLAGLSKLELHESIATSPQTELTKLHLTLHHRIATRPELNIPQDRAFNSIIGAISLAKGSTLYLRHFVETGNALLKVDRSPLKILKFCDIASDFTGRLEISPFRGLTYGQSMAQEALFLADELCQILRDAPPPNNARVLSNMAKFAFEVAAPLIRRRTKSGKRQQEALVRAILSIAASAQFAGSNKENISALEGIALSLQ